MEAPLVLIAARDESMQRFIALLLREVRATLWFVDDAAAMIKALAEQMHAVVILVSEVLGWPGAEAAAALRNAARKTSTVLVAHDGPGPDWEFVDAFIQLPFRSGQLADQVTALLTRRTSVQQD